MSSIKLDISRLTIGWASHIPHKLTEVKFKKYLSTAARHIRVKTFYYTNDDKPSSLDVSCQLPCKSNLPYGKNYKKIESFEIIS